MERPILTLIIFFILGAVCVFTYKLVEANTSYKYCGFVTDNYVLNDGSYGEEQRHLVFICDVTDNEKMRGKYIDIIISNNLYHNIKNEKRVCFEIKNNNIIN